MAVRADVRPAPSWRPVDEVERQTDSVASTGRSERQSLAGSATVASWRRRADDPRMTTYRPPSARWSAIASTAMLAAAGALSVTPAAAQDTAPPPVSAVSTDADGCGGGRRDVPGRGQDGRPRGDAFPDAVTAAPLAAALDAALLLTAPDAWPGATEAALGGLGVSSGSSSSEVPAPCRRRWSSAWPGPSRSAGSRSRPSPPPAAVAGEVVATGRARTSTRSGRAAFFVSGADFPDALVSGAPASATPTPVLLVAPDALPGATAAAVSRLGVGSGWVVGGAAAVPEPLRGRPAGARRRRDPARRRRPGRHGGGRGGGLRD